MNFRKFLSLTILFSLFTFSSFAADFYWVGNSGIWNDVSHWSSTSGGNGGVGIPTLNDNVFFDKKSFKKGSSLIVQGSANCNDFTWSNTKKTQFKSLINANLTVTGSFNVNEFYTNKFYGKTIFTSSQSQTNLFFDRSEFLGDIEFNGTGSWLLQSNLITTDSNFIYLKQGDLIANNITVFSGGIDASGSLSKKITTTDAVIYAHQKMILNNAPNFSFIRKNTDVILNKKATTQLGNFNVNDFTFSQKFIMQNTCGVIPLTVTLTVLTDFNGFGESCAGNCDGIVFVTHTGGVGPFTTSWQTIPPDGSTADTIFNVCSGNVGVIITDLGQPTPPFGFLQCSETIQVDAPVPLSLTFLGLIEPTCNGDNDGFLGVDINFGVPFPVSPDYTISWTNTVQTTEIITGLGANSYQISVIDANGCTLDSTFVLTEPPTITFALDSTNLNCFGVCDGDATVSNIIGGNGIPYSFSWSVPPGGNTSSISNLCAGTYVVTVSDDSLCFAVDSVTIIEVPQIQIDTTTTPISCGGDCDGTITTTVLGGGTGPFTHNWSNGVIFNGNVSTISNLCVGTYCDTIIDANGCDTVICIVLAEPDTVKTNTTVTDLTCNGICNGTAVTNTSGGTPNYTYVWTGPGGVSVPLAQGQGTDSIFGLCPGQYIVDIIDVRLCPVSDTIIISEPPPLIANPSSTNVTCPGFNDGTATANPTGGTGVIVANFGYSWTGPSCTPCLTQSIGSLAPGTYVVTVTDSLGCIAIDSVIITEPTPMNLVMTVTDESCFGVCDGTAGVTTTGGTGDPNIDFTYLWSSIPIGQVTVGQGTDSIFNLCSGNYTVFITDSIGCTASGTVTVNAAIAIVDNLVTTDLSCNSVCNGTATVSPTGGVGPYTVLWDGVNPPFNIPIGGSNTISNLCAGAHTALVTDANGCTLLLNFNITEPLLLTTTSISNDVSCFGLCDGDATTTPLGGTAPYTFSWDSIPTGAGFPINGNPITNLCAGIYFVTVTDDSLCTVTDTIQIFEPLEIFPNITFTDISCNGLTDGTAVSLPTGGVPGYTFNWSPVPGCYGGPANTQSINTLCAGSYTLTVTDANNCTGVETIIITDPLLLTVSANATAASCGTVCDGTALATVNGGTAGYTFVWTGPSGSINGNPATGLCIGIYTVTVTDTNGCIATDTTEILPLIQITINPTIVGISCNGVCDGTATVFPVGGTLPYTYLWNAPPVNTDSMITGLCPGSITVTVTDALGCATTDSINMPVDPSVLVPNGQIDQQVSCNGICDAMVSHAPTGGTPPYTSVWTLSNGIDTNNVCVGFATITVTDANGCIAPQTLTIVEPDSIIPNDVVVDILCNGDSTGSITLSPTGGAGVPFTFSWLPNVSNTNSATGLGAGIYQITITDANGCFIVVTDTIIEPPVLSAIPLGIDVSCFGLCDGMATVIVNGGTAPYTYSWAPNGETTDTLFNLCAPNLTNTVTVTDANGCIIAQTITINEPTQLNANVTGTPEDCINPCTGTALSAPTGGTPNYTFQWSVNALPNNLTNPNIANLCVGTYSIIVTDANGCTDSSAYIVTSPPPLTVTLDSTNITCNGDNDGTATATPIGGTAPFTFTWVGPPCNPNPGTTSTITNLCAGIYTVTILDFEGCSFIGSVTIVEPTPIDDNEFVVGANCGVNDGSITMFPSGGAGPYTHSWSNGFIGNPNQNLAAGFYTDTITDANGCVGIFTIAVTNPTGPSGITTTVNDATCFGICDGAINAIVIGGAAPFTFAWTGPAGFVGVGNTLTGLCAGTYNLTLTEINTGCILATSVIVGEADSITANSTFTDASCNGICDGTASVTPTGGTAPFSFLWSNGSIGSSVSGLCVGAVSVTITDFNNCTKVVNFNINSPNALVLSSTSSPTSCNGTCDGITTTNPVGGTAPYTFQWNDPLSQTTQTATGLCAGTYIVTVTDVNGCAGNDTVIVTEPTIIVANATMTNSTCGNADGTADVCASSGGTGTHTYNWTTLGGATTCNVSGLAAGTYPVEITDANGCMQTALITISDVNGPVIMVNSTNATCNGICDGQATATVVSGTPNFSFVWQTGGQTTPTITGLCAGSYTVEVTDGNGCVSTQPVTITDNTAITATVSTVDATCNGDCDGSVLVVPNGGIPPYNYSWTGGNAAGQTINAVGGLCAGNYTVTITDALGCSFIQNVTINEPNVLAVSIAGIAANCNGSSDGQATATPTGGTAPYTFLWSTGATTPTITALFAGNYTVTVTDVNGCTSNANVTIGDGVPITATITKIDVTGSAVTCAFCDGSITVSNIAGGSGGPYTLLWAVNGFTTPTINNLCPGAYSLTITDNAGCTQIFNVLINNQNGQASLNTQANDVSCFGSCDGVAFTTAIGGLFPVVLFQWDDPNLTANDTATGLCAGFYTVIMQDVVGCITVDSVTVFEPQKILTNLTSTPPTCAGVCDGTATVIPINGVGAYTVSWDGAAAINVAIGGSNTITGLCAGTHTVLITDANNCLVIDSVILIDPTNISITISAVSPTCFGDCDGTAIANASGGNPGYMYSWNTTPVQNNSLAVSLCSGNYIVTVTDNNGCTTTANVQVTDPLLLTTSSTPTPASCNGVCDGSIITNPTGGVMPYRYVWSNGDTTQTINNLCAGTYSVIIVDANNCTVNDTIIITDPALLDAGLNQTPPDCGICNGSIGSTPVGAGPFDFVWTDPLAPSPPIQTDLGVATASLVGLCAGTYDLQITDLGTGCISNYTITLNSANGHTLTMSATDETCISACDGTATAIPSGGLAPYTYSWVPTGPPTDTNQTATNLCVGSYTVTVTDDNGCITSDTISINTNGLNLTITSVVPETCFGDCDGTATVAVSGGTPTYIYDWNPTAQITPTATSLCVGTYIVTVTDANFCKDSISTTVTGPDELIVTASINSPTNCNGVCDGAAIANVIGGTQNYTFVWDDPLNQTTQIATGLCAGTYIVIVTDNNGCTATDTITLTEPTAILAGESFIDPNCGICDGRIDLVPSGGTGPYTFLWTTPTAPVLAQPITASIINLCAGAYSVIITDDVGCSTTFSFALSNVNAPTVTLVVIDATCNGVCDGSITSNTNGGTVPYTFFWSPNGEITPNINNLCDGQYTLNVTDALGCIGVAIDSVVEPDILQATINSTNISCNGVCDGIAVVNAIGGTTPYIYSWTPGGQITDSISGLCAGTHTVTVTDANNCPSIADSIDIIEPALITVTTSLQDVTCSALCDGIATVTPANGTGSYTFQWNGNTAPGQGNTQTNLCFGLNTVIITDQNGCSITENINLSATDTVLADAGLDTAVCFGASASLVGIPIGTFTNVEWFELPGMTSLGTTNSISVTPTAIGVTCYVFQVTGACVFTDTVCVIVEAPPVVDAGIDVNIFENGSTTLNATGGGTYSWTPSTGLSDTNIFNPVASPIITTTYFVTVTSTNGCIATDSVTVTVLPNINFPDGITPNGDGKNDVWIIDFIEEFPDNVVEIYNRWGEMLFHADGYQQDWDGTYRGKELPIGTYYYIIDLHDETIKPFTGPLTILR